ncbi:hypothetical protein [Streptomyces lavendulocolor]|uniref:hypothetical protein n=1 Tax=Streptomyces lavendulocolor TaxID=67316 RepID=UPI003C2E348A
MNPQTHLAMDGYVDAIPAPGTSWGTVRFDLIHSPGRRGHPRARRPGHRVRLHHR